MVLKLIRAVVMLCLYCATQLNIILGMVRYVNIACLGMSKAFDRVNLYALSIKLMKLSVLKSFISIILDWYGKVLVSVKWNNSVSAPRRLLFAVVGWCSSRWCIITQLV